MSTVTDEAPGAGPALDADTESPTLRFDISRMERDGRQVVTLYDESGIALHIDKGALTSATVRSRITNAAISRHPQLEQQRAWIADELLRRATERPPDAAAPSEQRAPDALDPAPWDDEVDGAILLDDIASLIRRYVVLDEASILVTALWALGTWCMEAFDLFPRLCLTSPERQCGKSTLLEVLTALVHRPVKADQTSEAALFRIIDRDHPTVLLDECDQWFVGRDQGGMVATINAGHSRTGTVRRCVGDDHEPRAFSVFGAMVLSGIGKLPETTASRCIRIPLRRKLPDERVTRLRLARLHRETDDMRKRCQRWAADSGDDVRAAIETEGLPVPQHGSDRDLNNAEPLIAVAIIAGGTWLTGTLRALSETFEATALDDEGTRTELLLADIRSAFERSGQDALPSATLVNMLTEDEDSAWAAWNRGFPLKQSQLARWLRPFGIRPDQIRFETRNLRGYRREWFDDAFRRYLP